MKKLKMDCKIRKIEKHSDSRGKLVVFLKSKELKKNNKEFGQVYFITFSRKGIVRGNHYHKNWREWFAVVDGKVQAELEDVRNKKHISVVLDAEGKDYIRLEIGSYVAHSFKSLSDSASLLNYAEKEWIAEDVFSYKLME
jgi:UDP-2-acetamido-2,6-beta-L-arabino-hexul-4-ose reductase